MDGVKEYRKTKGLVRRGMRSRIREMRALKKAKFGTA